MVRHRHEKPKPVGTIIGVVVCLGAIGGFLLLVNSGAIKGGKESSGSGGTEIKVVRPPTGTGGPQTVTRAPADPPSASGEVRVRFTGSLAASGDTRKVVYECPHCGKLLTEVGFANCTHCAKGVKWPQKVTCGFCSGGAKCGACKGSGKCPACGDQPRMLMGVRPPCSACNSSGKCPACDAGGKCEFCENGTYYPGQPKRPPAEAKDEPPPIPKPKEE